MTRQYRIGLLILGALSMLDVAGPLLTDGEHPPMAVALIGSLLGLVSLACVYLVWRGVTRAVLPLVVLRLLSALAAVPAFLVPDVPPAIRAFAAVLVLLTIVGVALVVGVRRSVAVRA